MTARRGRPPGGSQTRSRILASARRPTALGVAPASFGKFGGEIFYTDWETPDNQATPEYLAKLVKDETEKWAVPIKASGVTVE